MNIYETKHSSVDLVTTWVQKSAYSSYFTGNTNTPENNEKWMCVSKRGAILLEDLGSMETAFCTNFRVYQDDPIMFVKNFGYNGDRPQYVFYTVRIRFNGGIYRNGLRQDDLISTKEALILDHTNAYIAIEGVYYKGDHTSELVIIGDWNSIEHNLNEATYGMGYSVRNLCAYVWDYLLSPDETNCLESMALLNEL